MHFRSSDGKPSAPGARPFFSFRMARLTSSDVGASTGMSVSGTADNDMASGSGLATASG